MSLTYKPKKIKRKRTHGFLVRKSKKSGRKILIHRIRKGRHKISA